MGAPRRLALLGCIGLALSVTACRHHDAGPPEVDVEAAGPARDTAPADTLPPPPWAASLPTGWTALPAPPFARRGAAAVWTGDRLVYWSGENGIGEPETGGAVFEASTRRWSALPDSPLSPRARPAAVWTGAEVLLWGGAARGAPLGDGAVYDPKTATWRTLPRAPLSPRVPAAYAWTGTELLVWGDASRYAEARDGAAYDPHADRWRRIAPAPFALNQATAAWTGRELIVVGSGLSASNHARNPRARSLAYDPAEDVWRSLGDQPLSPQASAVAWNGEVLVAWDYLLGARTYDPAGRRWQPMPKLPLRPQECYPSSLALGRVVLAWYCGQAAVRLPSNGPPMRSTTSAGGSWTRVEPPVEDLYAEPVAAGEAALLLGSGAGSEPALWAYRPPDRPPPVKLVRLPQKRLEHCRRSRLLRPACPARVPEVDGGWWLSHLSTDLLGPRPPMHLFSLEHGGEWPDSPEWNRPPAMAHLVVVAGDIGGISPSADPDCARHEPLADGVMNRAREEVVCFGPLAAGARRGDLFLAPGFPAGGMIGNHLVFRWSEHGRRYALSLHAWEPLTETASVLTEIVAALRSA